MVNEIFEFVYNVLQEMLIVNHQEGFSYNMCYEGDVYSVTMKLNEQQDKIQQPERKIRKCDLEVGRLLQQIIELQDELQECRARHTLATDERGVVKEGYR